MICIGPVCVPLNLFLPFLLGVLHSYGEKGYGLVRRMIIMGICLHGVRRTPLLILKHRACVHAWCASLPVCIQVSIQQCRDD